MKRLSDIKIGDYGKSVSRSVNYLGNNALPNFRHGLNVTLSPDQSVIDAMLKEQNFSTFQFKLQDSQDGKLKGAAVENFVAGEFLNFEDVDNWFFHFNRAKNLKPLCVRIDDSSKKIFTLDLNFSSLPAAGTLFLMAEENSFSTIIIRRSCNANHGAYLGLNINVLAKGNANIKIILIQNYSDEVNAFECRTATVGKNASVSWSELVLGGAFIKSDTVSILKNSGASTEITALYACSGIEQRDIFTSAIHKDSKTSSDIVTRGFVAGSSKALCRGLIEICESASGSVGMEKQDVLMLGDKCQADAIPNLQIRNHDVECRHGSSVGQLDGEKLFYLCSKGMAQNDAKKIIVQGYFSSLMLDLPNSFKKEIDNFIERALA